MTVKERSDKKCFMGKRAEGGEGGNVSIAVLGAAVNLSGNGGRRVFNVVFGMVGEGGLLRGKAKIIAANLMWFIELPCRNIVSEITRCVKACGFFFKTNLQVTCREFLASIFIKTILDKTFKCQSTQGHHFP